MTPARDRDRLRQNQLEKLGWRFHRIWSTAWFRSKEQEIKRAVQVYEDTVNNHTGLQDEPVFENDALTTKPTATPTLERGPGPKVTRGLPIRFYSQGELRAVVEWVKADGRLRTEDELIGEIMHYFGFQRRGPRIVAAIQKAMKP